MFDAQYFLLIYTISVHCRKHQKLFVRALETGRKRQCTYIVSILQYCNELDEVLLRNLTV